MSIASPPTTDPAPADAAPPPRPRVRRWPLAVVAGALLLGLGVAASAIVTLPYYAQAPGQVIEVSDFVLVEGADTHFNRGDLYFLTVTSREVTFPEWIEAQLDGEVDLLARDVVRPPGVSRIERRRRGLDQQEEAKQRAVFVALTRLGYEPTLDGSGALVAGVVEGSAADGTLEVDDVIVAVAGSPVALAGDVAAALDGSRPGDVFLLSIERLHDDGATEVVEVEVELGEHPDDESRGFIGVSLDTFEFVAEFPIEVDIDSQNIGGPSSGLMYALGIINLLSPEDITRGHRIAGTGTIQRDGAVGPIGGVRQKVFAARRAGAEAVLVPVGNADDARTATGGEIEIVPVETIDDALAYLEGLPLLPPP